MEDHRDEGRLIERDGRPGLPGRLGACGDGTPPRLHTRDADTDEWVAGNKTIGAIAPILYDD
ncbi:hypothetical protein BDI4_130069 [Burkholderia diffusa]|nr:hypothetical protein BDI4_130069 [Burkholderia diffusa]